MPWLERCESEMTVLVWVGWVEAGFSFKGKCVYTPHGIKLRLVPLQKSSTCARERYIRALSNLQIRFYVQG